MTDSWEDWEKDDYEVPVLNVQQREEQLKRIEERRLVEESDNALTNKLFQKENNKEKDVEEDLVYEDLNQKPTINQTNTNNVNKTNQTNKTNKVNKNKENEQKQKELSKKLKEEKARREKEKDLFGEAEYDDEYANYEDKFY